MAERPAGHQRLERHGDQSGAQVTADNANHNRTIDPGASVSFGFQATHNGSNTPPTQFTLNGAPCATA